MTDLFFADTYALLGYIYGNKAYFPYFAERIITSKMNLVEMYYILLRDNGETYAEQCLADYSRLLIEISDSSIRKAMRFRLEHRKDDPSYVDCLGYALAHDLGVPFLTGDARFENEENVAFVK